MPYRATRAGAAPHPAWSTARTVATAAWTRPARTHPSVGLRVTASGHQLQAPPAAARLRGVGAAAPHQLPGADVPIAIIDRDVEQQFEVLLRCDAEGGPGDGRLQGVARAFHRGQRDEADV